MLCRNTTTYTWDVNSSLPVVFQDGTYTYVYGLDLISQTDGSGNQSYFLGNGLGSTEALTDGSGTITATYKYDVFGLLRSGANYEFSRACSGCEGGRSSPGRDAFYFGISRRAM